MKLQIKFERDFDTFMGLCVVFVLGYLINTLIPASYLFMRLFGDLIRGLIK